MKCIKVSGSRCGLLPYYLRGQQLALALLLRDKPRTAAQLAAALTEKTIPVTRRRWKNRWPALQSAASCQSPTVSTAAQSLQAGRRPYTENQLLDLVGMTQSTVNGTAFYTAAPPASVSSRGSSGS